MMEESVVNIGAVLRSQREKLGYSLKEISEATRIRKTFLESLEDNQFTDLPGHVYVVGFIKSYALYLGLDCDSLLAELEEPETSSAPRSLASVPITKSQSKRSGKHAKEGWSTFVLGLFVVLMLAGAIYLLLPMFQAKDLDKVTANKTATEQGTTEQKPVQVQAEAAKKVPKTVPPAVTPSLQKEPSPVGVETKTQESQPLPPVPHGGSSLRMLALAESSLIIYVDERKSQQYNLHDGLDLTWNIKASVKVEFAEPEVARFWLGDRELDLGGLKSFQLQSTKPR